MTRVVMGTAAAFAVGVVVATGASTAEELPKPYSAPCVEREDVFAFTGQPAARKTGEDKYEITFAVKGNCDVTVGVIDGQGRVVRHLASGVLGSNAPAPFQKNALKQIIFWNGKDDLGEYPKEPGRLRARVMLGLKPEFDKALGGTSAYRIPHKRIFGLAAGPDAIYVLSASKGPCFYLRKFDRDGNYLRSLVPPPADLPEDRLSGAGFVEFEPGRKALQATAVNDSVSVGGNYLPDPGVGHSGVQPVVVGDRFYYVNSGYYSAPSLLFYLNTDGSTDFAGSQGQPMLDLDYKKPLHLYAYLAASPDGRYIYMVPNNGRGGSATEVWRRSAGGAGPAGIFVGERDKPGSDDLHLNGALGIACDSSGRVYVCDRMNSRVQVFAQDGTFVRSLPVDSPRLVAVHGRTGAVYVQHSVRIQGKSFERVTAFASAEDFRATATLDEDGEHMSLDWRGDRPRLWLAGSAEDAGGWHARELEEMESASAEYGDPSRGKSGTHIRMWEEKDGKFNKLADFDERAAAEDGPNGVMNWTGGCLGYRVACDPLRETVHFSQSLKGFTLAVVFDLPSGRPLYWTRQPGATDDIIFDKRGYMHCHLNPLFCQQGVVRVDPAQRAPTGDTIAGLPVFSMKEVPYDYGIEGTVIKGCAGVIPTKDQPGAKSFQDGIGVNMRGDLAVESNIYYVPKMDEIGRQAAWAGVEDFGQSGRLVSGAAHVVGGYAAYLRRVEDAQKRGEEVYFIRREAGISLAGGTIWTYNRAGELLRECAVNAGDLINGSHIDEDGALYFTSDNTKMCGESFFLQDRGGVRGGKGSDGDRQPFTGTLIKAKPGQRCAILRAGSPIKLDRTPERPPDLMDIEFPGIFGKSGWAWAEGAEWMYAGASPMVATGCSCPKQNFHLDWYKRCFVPEGYRHSIGVVDTAGNLILHIGQYGNFDSGFGPKSRIPPGGDGIGMTQVRFVSATDNYLVFEDHGERLIVLKLNYHAEETVGIQ